MGQRRRRGDVSRPRRTRDACVPGAPTRPRHERRAGLRADAGGGGHALARVRIASGGQAVSRPRSRERRPNPEQSTTRSPRAETGARVPAVTHFSLVTRSTVDRCSLVLAIPETGRGHKIRRHLRHLGHPLVGDVNYGSGEINRHYRATYDLRRLALHAYAIAFNHPVSGARVAITAPMPDDMGLALERLGLPRGPLLGA